MPAGGRVTWPSVPSRFFFFNDTATTEIYTLSLHDALPISQDRLKGPRFASESLDADTRWWVTFGESNPPRKIDRKSTRLNSSHQIISYAVFCLKKKKTVSRSLSTCSQPPRGHRGGQEPSSY